MRVNSLVLATASIFAGLALSGTAFAQDRGSAEDQLACTPDVYRLCSSYVPDEGAITACLKRNFHVLSAGCQRVFSRPDTPPSQDQSDD